MIYTGKNIEEVASPNPKFGRNSILNTALNIPCKYVIINV
jgi:hypothetical protein